MINTLYEPFRHWSEKGSVYILSDTHFADSDCKLMDPGWITPEEQVAIINSMAHRSDTFICLGDVGSPEYARQLKAGWKVLILGNHDRRSDYTGIFNEIYIGPLIVAEKILLSHEPVLGLEWCLNIHGHDHAGTLDYHDGYRHLNLAANVCGYKPVSLAAIIKQGALSGIDGIHRITIDGATAKKYAKENDKKKELEETEEERKAAEGGRI